MADRDLLVRQTLFRVIVGGLFLVLVINLFIMMVPRHDYYDGQALRNRQDQFRVRAPRGRILDRQGTLLADNTYIADIIIPGSSIRAGQPDSTLERLMTWFDLPVPETLERLEKQKSRGAGLVLISNATMPQIVAVEERGQQLPGVRVESRPRRRYQYGPLFAHVIGYVGEVGTADLDTTETGNGYRIGDMKGKQGVEVAFEEVLRGQSGLKLEEVNAGGRVVGRQTVWLRDVDPGRDVTLSLVLPLQQAMAEIIGDRTACSVALDVRTGEVLAAYSHPTFDPNLMTVPITEESWNRLVNDPEKPFFNRIVAATYPPASLYKAVTSLAALKARVVGSETLLEPCLGGWTFGNRYFRCWKHSGHGLVDHAEAVIQSCDTYYYQIALQLQLDQLAAAARAFGLGDRCTAIFSEESRGNVPDTAWYNQRFGEGKWTQGVVLNNSIGQGELLVTPLQMAVLTGRIASSGRMPDPIFVLDPPEPIRVPEPLPFSEQHLAWMRRTLWRVVEEGTGNVAAVEGLSVAGKTGTAQNPHGDDHAWFMCFAPYEDPEVALAVIVENAGSGSSEAAPVAGAWLNRYLEWRNRNDGPADESSVP